MPVDNTTYFFGHSLIQHVLDGNEQPVPERVFRETGLPYWLHEMADTAGHDFSYSGTFGNLQNYARSFGADGSFSADWGLASVPESGLASTGSFGSVGFDSVVITPRNFGLQSAPATASDPDFGGASAVARTLEIVDWVVAQEPGITVYIYEHWPDMGTYGAGFTNGVFDPSPEVLAQYHSDTMGRHHNWFVDYTDALQAARPGVDIQLIPVGSLIAEMLTRPEFGLTALSGSDLYQDDAPHGQPTLYFLASMIVYTAQYGETPPADFAAPSSIHPAVRSNFDAISDFIGAALDADTGDGDAPVVPVNTAPEANRDWTRTDEDEAVTIDLLANDVDADGDALQIIRINTPENGTVVNNGDGTVTYTPDPGFHGRNVFDYTISDGTEEATGRAVVRVREVSDPVDDNTPIAPANSAPIALQESIEVYQQANVLNPLDNDTDPDGDALVISGITLAPRHGWVRLDPDGTLTYTPLAGYTGSDEIRYQISDGRGGTSEASIYLEVNAGRAPGDTTSASASDDLPVVVTPPSSTPEPPSENRAPVGETDFFEVYQDANILDVLANDTDVNGDRLSIVSLATEPAHGTVRINTDGTLTYTPNSGYTGTDHFWYEVGDGRGGVSGGAVYVEVNDGPNPEGATTAPPPSPEPVTPEPPAPEPEPATPSPDPAPVVPGPNLAPEGNLDFFEVYQQANVLDVLRNDRDADGDDLSIHAVATQPSHGTVVINTDGTLTYTPNAGYTGPDHFWYEVSDGRGGVTGGPVYVEVNPGTDPAGATPLPTPLPPAPPTPVEPEPEPEPEPVEPEPPVTQPRVPPQPLPGAVADIVGETDRAVGLTDPTLSMGLAGVVDYGVAMQFLDIMKMSRPWIIDQNWDQDGSRVLSEAGLTDENGWLREMPAGVNTVETVWAWEDADAAPSRAGTYVLNYDGDGDFDLSGVEILSRSEGEVVFRSDGGFMALRITDPDSRDNGDYLRNITIVKEEHVALFEAGAIFNPDWIEVVNDYREFRYMDWMQTNNSLQEEWSDRPVPGTVSYSNGVPIEVIVRLANETGTDAWVNMPHNATEEYVREMATYVRDHLDPDLKVTVEYSNEVWNWAFGHTNELMSEAAAVWDLSESDFEGRLHYISKLQTETALVWQDVFAGEPEDRLVNTLGTFAGYTYYTETYLNPTTWRDREPDAYVDPTTVFDTIAITTYFGVPTITRDDLRRELIEVIEDPAIDAFEWLRDRLLDPAYEGSIPQAAAEWRLDAEAAARNGLGLTVYEGGQHVHHSFATGAPRSELDALQDFMTEFVRSPEMAELYEELWTVWEEIGDGPFMQFGELGASTIYGTWGLLQFLGDSNPRSELLEELNASVSAWWEDRGGARFQHGVTEDGTTGADAMSGTNKTDYLLGAGGDDTLVGGAGDDGLNGGNGRDLLYGNSGDDTLVGGAGADTFWFHAGDGNDVVRDFEIGTDAIAMGTAGASFGDLDLDLRSDGTLVRHGNGDSILVQTTTGQALSASDFDFA